MKIYRVKVNGKLYEVELEAVSEVKGSIVVKDEQLTTEKVAQIQNIISREMNAKAENIHISNK